VVASQAHAVVAYSQHELAFSSRPATSKRRDELGLQTVADGVFNERLQQHRWDSQPPGTAISTSAARPSAGLGCADRPPAAAFIAQRCVFGPAVHKARAQVFVQAFKQCAADFNTSLRRQIEVRDSTVEEMNSEIEARSRGTTIYA